jgi:hypothetical protein
VTATCADTTRRLHEPLAGTAPTALGWLCVEQGGAWGRTAERESGLDAEVAAHLLAGTEDAPVRLQLIRRPAARATDTAAAGTRTVLLAHAGERPWLEVLEVDDVRDLLDLDPAVCTSSTPPGIGRHDADPRYLVCTHAKRDRCCATWGRPIADTLAALRPDQTWEVSHVGGHRFAANLVVLPHGSVHGGLDVAGAVRVVDLAAAGRLDLASARGRSGLPRPAQAAELFLRTDLGVDHLDAVRFVEVEDLGHDRTRVHLVVRDEAHVVEVVLEPTGVPRPTSCDSDDLDDPGAYRLLTFTAT